MDAAGHGIGEVATWVVGDSVAYEPYVETRKFYEAHGFKVYRKNRTDNPDCSEEYLVSKSS